MSNFQTIKLFFKAFITTISSCYIIFLSQFKVVEIIIFQSWDSSFKIVIIINYVDFLKLL